MKMLLAERRNVIMKPQTSTWLRYDIVIIPIYLHELQPRSMLVSSFYIYIPILYVRQPANDQLPPI